MEQVSETKPKLTLYYQSQLLNQCLQNLLLSQTYNANSRLKLQCSEEQWFQNTTGWYLK